MINEKIFFILRYGSQHFWHYSNPLGFVYASNSRESMANYIGCWYAEYEHKVVSVSSSDAIGLEASLVWLVVLSG